MVIILMIALVLVLLNRKGQWEGEREWHGETCACANWNGSGELRGEGSGQSGGDGGMVDHMLCQLIWGVREDGNGEW